MQDPILQLNLTTVTEKIKVDKSCLLQGEHNRSAMYRGAFRRLKKDKMKEVIVKVIYKQLVEDDGIW